MAVMVQKEGLVLNAEQAKALRLWWEAYDGHSLVGDKSIGLHSAITPLMKPWKLRSGSSRNILDGPNGLLIECYHKDNAKGEAYEGAAELCDILNDRARR